MNCEKNNNSDIFKAVKSNTLIPKQQVKSSSKILRSADSYLQRFLKFDEIGLFHSYSEMLYAALLEADPNVSTFTPQPLSMRVGKRRYIPDCYFVKFGKRYVVELKPGGEFREDVHIPVKAFLEFHGIDFQVVSNESVLEQELTALNWLQIIRTLLSAKYEDTHFEEVKVWDGFLQNPVKCIGDVISTNNRINKRESEIALFRLIHLGKLSIDFNDRELSYESEVSLCG